MAEKASPIKPEVLVTLLAQALAAKKKAKRKAVPANPLAMSAGGNASLGGVGANLGMGSGLGNSRITPGNLGGIGLDVLASGLTGFGGAADANVLRQAAGIFQLGFSMAGPDSFAGKLAQKAYLAQQQQENQELMKIAQAETALNQVIKLKKKLKLPTGKEDQAQLQQINQAKAKLAQQRQQFMQFTGGM